MNDLKEVRTFFTVPPVASLPFQNGFSLQNTGCPTFLLCPKSPQSKKAMMLQNTNKAAEHRRQLVGYCTINTPSREVKYIVHNQRLFHYFWVFLRKTTWMRYGQKPNRKRFWRDPQKLLWHCSVELTAWVGTKNGVWLEKECSSLT